LSSGTKPFKTMNSILARLFSLGITKRTAEKLLKKKGSPLYFGAVIHCERIYDTEVFEKLLLFSKIVPARAALCVMTPENPYIRSQMEKHGVDMESFSNRLKMLSEVYDIGFHGHWCAKRGAADAPFQNPGRISEIERAGFRITSDDPAEVRKQFSLENAYLGSLSFKPRIYSAGWWYLNREIVKLLDEHGYTSDCSVRHGQGDSFGGAYISDKDLPERGIPFRLSPSKNIIEFAGISYLNFNWWSLAMDLRGMLSSPKESFVTVPLHDYNLTRDMNKITNNIRFLSAIKNCRWSGLIEMRAAAESVL
jgi:hypothetical protein